MTRTYFRLLIVLSIVLGLAVLGIDLWFPDLVPEAVRNAIESEPMPGFIENNPFLALVIFVPWLIASIAGVVGLLLLKRWGRSLSLYSTMAYVLIAPFMGIEVYSGLSSALNEASTTIWGAVLALAYFSEAKAFFGGENRRLAAQP